jgi:FkbM family methyltransferase
VSDPVVRSRVTPWGDTVWYVPGDRSLGPDFPETGAILPHELRALGAIVRPGDVVLDVGANLGYVTCYLAWLTGMSGLVHAIEPSSGMRSLLYRNVAVNGHANVRISGVALGPRRGRARLWLSSSDLGRHSLHVRNVPAVADSELVPQLPTDVYWIEQMSSVPVALLKLDVEGAELAVLESARKMLAATRHVWLEFWPAGIEAAGGDPFRIVNLLIDAGFRLRQWNLVNGENHPVTGLTDVRAALASFHRTRTVDGRPVQPVVYLHGTTI